MNSMSGGMGGAERVGRTVRKPVGPSTPAVHALLTYMADIGLRGVPRVIGVQDGRSVLAYVDGRSVPADETVLDTVLVEAVAWLRDFHDAVESFVSPGDAQWRGGSSTGSLICHNDPGTYNWLIEAGHFVAMVDWDLAGPGERVDDLAFLVWTGLPLSRHVPIDEVERRIDRVVDTYPEVGPAGLLNAVAARMDTAISRIEAGVASGDPGFAQLAARGEPDRTRLALDAFRARFDR